MENGQDMQGGKLELVNQLAQKTLGYMQEKYQRSFVIASLSEGNFLSSLQTFRMYAQGDNPDTSMAVVHVQNYGESFSDNYFGLQVREEYEERVRQVLAPVFKDLKVFSAGFLEEGFKPDLGAGKTYADALAMGERMTGILYLYTQDEARVALKSKDAVTKALLASGMDAMVKVIVLKPPYAAEVNRDNFTLIMPYYRDVKQEKCMGILDFFVTADPAETEDTGAVTDEQEES